MDIKDIRNRKGLVLWFIAAVVLGWIAEVLMLAREWWQCRKYENPFEWDDAKRYSVVILWGWALHFIIRGLI